MLDCIVQHQGCVPSTTGWNTPLVHVRLILLDSTLRCYKSLFYWLRADSDIKTMELGEKGEKLHTHLF